MGRGVSQVRGRVPFVAAERVRQGGRNPQAFSRGRAAIGVAKAGFGAARTVGGYAGKAVSYGMERYERGVNRKFISGEVSNWRAFENGQRMRAQAERELYGERRFTDRELDEIEARNYERREAMKERAEQMENARRFRDPAFEKKVSELATKILEKEIDRRRDLKELVKRMRAGRATSEERKAFYDLMGSVTKHAMKELGKPIE